MREGACLAPLHNGFVTAVGSAKWRLPAGPSGKRPLALLRCEITNNEGRHYPTSKTFQTYSLFAGPFWSPNHMRKTVLATLVGGAFGAVALATPSIAAMHFHPGGAMPGPSAHHYSAPRVRAYSPGRPRLYARTFHRRGRGVFFAAGYPYYYNDYGYGGCGWLYRRAVATGSPYWWNRYRACVY
jgi:hypothetical protein